MLLPGTEIYVLLENRLRQLAATYFSKAPREVSWAQRFCSLNGMVCGIFPKKTASALRKRPHGDNIDDDSRKI